jgi:uncharacterized membrane protein (UPF0127 family)
VRLIALIAAGLAACVVSAPVALAACSDDRLEMRGDFGSVRFRGVIADTPQERAQGLMHVPEMPRMSGMLFVYERPQSVSFWMENTLIPLDMIFADETGLVRRIHENAIPLDRTPIPGGPDIQYVLEINGGMAATLGLSEGDQMRHPAIAQDVAIWPCAAE